MKRRAFIRNVFGAIAGAALIPKVVLGLKNDLVQLVSETKDKFTMSWYLTKNETIIPEGDEYDLWVTQEPTRVYAKQNGKWVKTFDYNDSRYSIDNLDEYDRRTDINSSCL